MAAFAPGRPDRFRLLPVATFVGLTAAAAGLTAGLDGILSARVSDGSDHALRLATILNYVGVGGAYTLARALGIAALVTAYASVLTGLLLGEGRARGGRPGPLAAMAHRQLGLLTIALVAGHAAVPFSSVDPPFRGWRTNFVPFAQPFSWGSSATTWESLGILAFYLFLLTGPTFYLMGGRRRWWSRLHRLVAAAYVLSVLHALFLGTDFLVRGPARIAILAAQIPLLVLAGRRLDRVVAGTAGRWVARSAGLVGAAALTVVTVLVATNQFAGGMQL